jgi:hypothetical protein
MALKPLFSIGAIGSSAPAATAALSIWWSPEQGYAAIVIKG